VLSGHFLVKKKVIFPEYRVGVFNSRCFCSFFFELFVEHFPEKFLEKSKISCSKEAHFGEPDVSEHPPS
jgi:hypothetical protein